MLNAKNENLTKVGEIMSTLREIVYQTGWAKIEMESIVFFDDSQPLSGECSLLPIYYVRLADGRVCKLIPNHDIDNVTDFVGGYHYDILNESSLDFDSWMVECNKRVIDDQAEYSDSTLDNPQIRIAECDRVYYGKTSLCSCESLPVDVIQFLEDEVACKCAV